jgi:hypothetical protein
MERIPGALTHDEAAALLSPADAVAQESHCSNHQVTTCPTCNGLWQLNQLCLRYEGYFPEGAPMPTPAPAEDDGAEIRPLPPTGARYSRRCPFCQTNLTDLVTLHHDACRLTPTRR